MNDVMNIVISLEESVLLIKDISETITNGVKEQKGGFLGWLLRTLGVNLLGNLLTGKCTVRAGKEATTMSQGRGTIRAGQNF